MNYYERASQLLRRIGMIPNDLIDGMVDPRWPEMDKRIREVEEALIEAEDHGMVLQRLNRRRQK